MNSFRTPRQVAAQLRLHSHIIVPSRLKPGHLAQTGIGIEIMHIRTRTLCSQIPLSVRRLVSDLPCLAPLQQQQRVPVCPRGTLRRQELMLYQFTLHKVHRTDRVARSQSVRLRERGIRAERGGRASTLYRGQDRRRLIVLHLRRRITILFLVLRCLTFLRENDW